MDTLKDGTGTGYLARVGPANKLDVSARVNDRIYYASKDDGKAFTVQFELTQASGGSAEGVGYITYTGNDRLNIKQIAFSTEDAGTTSFGVWKEPTVSGGATATPVNLNFSSNNTANVTCAEDADGTTVSVTGGSSIFTVRQNGPGTQVIDLYDAIILGSSNTIAFKGSASTTSSKVRINVMFAESIL